MNLETITSITAGHSVADWREYNLTADKKLSWSGYRRRIVRHRLIVLLGSKCVGCGKEEWEVGPLEFAHIGNTRTWVCRDFGWLKRMVKYYEDAQAGVLELRCKKCHKGYSAGDGSDIPD